MTLIDITAGVLLFAQDSRLEGFAKGFRPREGHLSMGSVLVGLMIVAGFIVGLWLLARLADRGREKRPSNSPARLFLSLCRAHGLRWPDRWLLWRVARHHRLSTPARIFIEPERLEPAGLGQALLRRADRLRALREGLFCDLERARPQEPARAETSSEPSLMALLEPGLPADLPLDQVPMP
jgi:hypothetical protein